MSHYFLSINRGKKSIVLDLKTAEGVAVAQDLAARCDILVENYRPGVMERLGLGYEALAATQSAFDLLCHLRLWDDRPAAGSSLV